MCVFECECVLQSGRRGCGREKGVQVLNSLSLTVSLSEVWMDVEYFCSQQQSVSVLWRLMLLQTSSSI